MTYLSIVSTVAVRTVLSSLDQLEVGVWVAWRGALGVQSLEEGYSSSARGTRIVSSDWEKD